MSTARAVTSNSIYWLALSLTPGVGPTRGRKLVERFAGIQDVFHASLTELEAENLQAHSAQHIALGKSLELATDEIAKAAASGIQIICRDDESWPQRLSEIYDPPLVLYVRGNIEALSRPGLAIIGTRHPTPYGIGMAERLSCDLASRGLAIFSGMARGIVRFVRIAMGSASELDYHLLLAHDFGYLQSDEHKGLSHELTRIRKMLASLLATLESGTKQKAAGAGGSR